jgi:hypothetical protein
MAIYVPGIEQSGPAIGQLTAAIMQKMHPNAALQDKMQLQLAMNPKLLQEWAKLEKLAPGIGERMGFGGLSGIIQAVPETAADTVERTTKDLAVKTGQQEAQNKATEVDTQAKINQQIVDMIKADSTLTYDAAMRRLTGETASGRIVSQEEAKLAPILGKAKIANAELDITTANLHKLVADRALMQFGDTEKTDFYALAQQVAAGKADGKKLMTIMSTPGAAEAMNMAMQNVHFNREQSRLEALRSNSDDKLSYTDKYYMQKAFTMFNQTNVGSLDAWKKYLAGGSQMRAAVEKLKDIPADQLSPEHRDLLAVHNSMKDQQTQDRVKSAATMSNAVGQAIRDVNAMVNSKNPPDASTIQARAESINSLLEAKAGVEGSPQYFAHYGKIPGSGTFFDDEGLYFTDKSGKVVDEGTVSSMGVQQDTTVTGKANRAYMVIEGMTKNPGESVEQFAARKQAAVDRVQRTDPEVYKAMLARMHK